MPRSISLVLISTALAGLVGAAAGFAQSQADPDALQSGTIWTGTVAGDPRAPSRDSDRGAVLRVTSRDGDKFEAEFVVRGNATFALALEGRVSGGQVATKVTRIIKGRWPNGTTDDVWTGTLAGEELVLKHTSKQNLVATATLRLDASAAPGKRGKGKQK